MTLVPLEFTAQWEEGDIPRHSQSVASYTDPETRDEVPMVAVQAETEEKLISHALDTTVDV